LGAKICMLVWNYKSSMGRHAQITAELEGAKRQIAFAEPIEHYYAEAGHVPFPPYIHNPNIDPERYQTVYNQIPGSAAAPTAGLHFTERLMQSLQTEGIGFAEITLHVGLDTFAPVTEMILRAIKSIRNGASWMKTPPSASIIQGNKAGA